MSSVRELRVVLNHHQQFKKIPSVGPNEVMVYRRPTLRSSLDPNKHSKSSKGSKTPSKMKKEPETSKTTTSKRLTRSSLKTPPPPPIAKKRGRPKKSTGMRIKQENSLEIKQEPVDNNEITPMKGTNNNTRRDYPLTKRQKRNPVTMIDLTGPEILEIKQEDQSDISSTLDSPTCEQMQLNYAFIDKTASTNDTTIELSINNENDQNIYNKHTSYSINSEELDFVDENITEDIENLIKVHVINISDTDESERTHSSPSKSSPDQKTTEDIEILTSKSSETHENHQIHDVEDPEDPPETKMKCLTEIISEVFDSKLPDSEERMYFTMQHVLDEYKQERKRQELKRDGERKKYERTVLSNVQGIKMMLTKMNKKRLMIDQMTQTDESLESSETSTEDPIDHPDVEENVKEVTEDQKHDENAIESVETIPEEDKCLSDLPADDLAGMIVLDSLDTSNDHQGSVFQRLGHKSPVKSLKNVQELLESPENPSPGPLKLLELQREMIERHNRECNIVIEGFRCSKSRVEAEISEYLWKKIGINAGVVRVMRMGDVLVVTVATHFIKKQILKRRSALHRSIRIISDYTGRERKVQQWLGDEVRRRKRDGQNVRAAYGKIYVGGVWWFWNEIEGKLTRNPFRPELVSME